MARGRYPWWCQRPPADVVCCQLISAQVLKNLSAFTTWAHVGRDGLGNREGWGALQLYTRSPAEHPSAPCSPERAAQQAGGGPQGTTLTICQHHFPAVCSDAQGRRPVASPDMSPSPEQGPTPPIPAPLFPFKSRFLQKLSMDTMWAPSASPCSSLTGRPHVFCLLKCADEMLELLAVDKLAANYWGLESYKLITSRGPMKQYPDCIGSISSFLPS